MTQLTSTFRKLTAVAALLFLVAGSVFAQSNRIALLTEVSGSVELARAGSNTFNVADWGSPLFEGDRIRTAAGAEAVVLFSNNNLTTVSAGNTFTVSGSSQGSGRSVSGSIISSDADLTLHRAGQGEIEVLGGLRNSGASSALGLTYPVNTRVMTSRPTFTWTAGDDFDMYTISLRSSTGVIWEAETDETTLDLPADVPALEAGQTYYWEVTGEAMLDEVSSGLMSFEVMDAASQTALDEGIASLEEMYVGEELGSAYYYLLGTLYAQHGAIGEAIGAFEWIAEHHPASGSVHRILGNLYAEAGMKDDAIRALKKAADLSKIN